MEIAEAIEKRWSPRAYSDQNIDTDLLKEIIKKAGRAPSSFNEQPWRLIVGIKGRETYEKVAAGLNEFNAKWATTAPVLIVGIAKQTFSRNDNENRHAWHDLGAFSTSLALAAIEHDIYIHQMAGILPDKIRETFSIPEGYDVVTILAMGYQGDKSEIPEDLQAGESARSPRKELSEFVFENSWEETLK